MIGKFCLDWTGAENGWADLIRIIRGQRHAGLLRAGGAQSVVHTGLCRCLRARIALRVPAGRLAVRTGGGDLGWRCAAQVDAHPPRNRIARAGAAVLA